MRHRYQLVRFELHEGGSTYNYSGSEGYTVPDSGGISVTFQVNEPDGRYLQMTEVVKGPFPSYDAAVEAAYLSLERRLTGIGKLGESLRQFREQRDAEKTAESDQ